MNDVQEIIHKLRQRLSRVNGTAGDWPGVDSLQHRPAAVLVPLVLHERPTNYISVLLTRRTDHLHHHPGQISFPGGGMEDEDGSAEEAALREAEEEIGLAPERVELIGRLPDYFTGTGFRVTPVVGLLHSPVKLRLDSFEVAEAFEVPLAHFLDPANHKHYTVRLKEDGETRQFHAMPWGNYFIWGATAGMMMTLYQLFAD